MTAKWWDVPDSQGAMVRLPRARSNAEVLRSFDASLLTDPLMPQRAVCAVGVSVERCHSALIELLHELGRTLILMYEVRDCLPKSGEKQ